MSDLIDRDEAIEAVCSVVMGRFDYSPTYAYEIAEEALEKLPSAEKTQLSGEDATFDCISRQDAIKALGEEPLVWTDSDEELADYNRWEKDVEAIKRVPTVHPKKGEWMEKEVEDRPVIEQWQSARCSQCGKYHTIPYMYYFDEYAFCPHCGARMKDVENDVPDTVPFR